MNIIPVILSGGSGTRLWPLSRQQYPKQYLPLASEQTMLQETILRLQGLTGLTSPIVVCNAEHRFLVAEQLQQISIKNPTILLEPVGRNTAPAITAAAFYAQNHWSDSVLLILSADHLIQNIAAFHQAIDTATRAAFDGALVTFGIVPDAPNTGYGYIKAIPSTTPNIASIESFVEKPDLNTAKQYLKDGNYLWNSGMFVFQSQTLIDEMNQFNPEIIKAVKQAVQNAEQDLDFIRLDKQAFQSSPSDSIDYALMEKTTKAKVVSLDAGWNDIGSWTALYEVGNQDAAGNVIVGDVKCDRVKNTYINANHHMVAAIGVEDLIIVDTPDATLVATQTHAKDVKNIVEQLRKQNRDEPQNHRKVYRPWGWYDSIDQEPGFQVKRIGVNPHARLSLQMHHKRSEHWVVIKGVATVTRGDECVTLNKNQSTYIPIGMKHSLANETDSPLEIIEIQCGDYLGEDDIVRFEDVYGRVTDD